MLAAASSFFGRTNISQTYNIGNTPSTPTFGSRSSTPGPSSSSGVPTSPLPITTAQISPFNVGLWRVQSAFHKTTNKRVSVWSFDKRSQEMEHLSPLGREHTLQTLKAEASALGRLRHPCILEMVEPLEETRNELIFATEPLISSLQLSIPNSSRSSNVELDEVEIQKGILQLCKGLSFLHTSARLIHSNINIENILINSSGDWKISGLGLTIPLIGSDGKPTRWEFPTFDGRVPPYVQRSFDYMAPEYALDEVLDTASDMYSLGCVIYAVHCKGAPPFRNYGSLGGLRKNAAKSLTGIERLDSDLQALLTLLITRQPQNRPSPSELPSHPFFSSLIISTLNFLDRSNFATKSREEKISFMKGLTSVLSKFSDGLRIRKILPSLLEEMKDTHILPYILPNVFTISANLSSITFSSLVLPNLKPLFALKEPPQNMLTLLDNLQLLQNKTEKSVFREHVLPLVYNALESEHAVVQERALKVVPDLCETVDYAEVQGVLFPRVALVFTKTRILSVKVATLVTFLSMVKTLDQTSLTQKLVPLLSKIRTKEPAVMTATLAVQEAVGMKVDREAVATLILPQLWAMSMGPLLNVEQFQRFMAVIKKLGDRVEKEHNQFLRDSQRLEDRSAIGVNGTPGGGTQGATIDFESLVGRANGATVKPDTVMDNTPSWDDDPWGSILAEDTGSPPMQQTPAPAIRPHITPLPQQSQSTPSSPKLHNTPVNGSRTTQLKSTRVLGASAFPASSFNATAFPPPPTQRSTSLSMSSSIMQPLQPTNTGGSRAAALQPQKPNYNVSLSDIGNTSTMPSILPPPASSPLVNQVSQPNYSISLPPVSQPLTPNPPPMSIGMSSQPLFASPAMSSLLTPSKPSQPQYSSNMKQISNNDWGDFDPLA